MNNPTAIQGLRQEPEAGKIKELRVEPFVGGEGSIVIGALTKTRAAWLPLTALPSVRGEW